MRGHVASRSPEPASHSEPDYRDARKTGKIPAGGLALQRGLVAGAEARFVFAIVHKRPVGPSDDARPSPTLQLPSLVKFFRELVVLQ